MTGTRERVLNTFFSNRGAIVNAAASVKEGQTRARDRASASRAVAVADVRLAAKPRRPRESRDSRAR